METELENQIELLKKYGLENYFVENGKITINGSLDLEGLQSIPDSAFLANTTINGSLDLEGLQSIPDSAFLANTTINGSLDLEGLQSIPDSAFLANTTINGSLDLEGLQSIPDSAFLANTTINGFLDLRGLQSIPDSAFLANTTINGFLDLEGLQSIPDSAFLANTTINGFLYLRGLQSIPDSAFLANTTINGFLDLEGLQSIPDSAFLANTTINGSLDLEGLQSIPDSAFLANTTINGSLDLEGLQLKDKETLRNNVSQLKEGYNKEKSYCFFDGILSKVKKVTQKKDYTIFETPIEFIVKKGNYTAHGDTIKKAIQDLEFKIVAEKLKNEPIKEDTEFTVKYYRLLTGACDAGCRSWMQNNEIEFKVENGETVELKPIKAKDLLPILQKSNAYGYEKFKQLVTF